MSGKRRHVPGMTRPPRVLYVLPGTREGATGAERLALEIRNRATVSGVCACGARMRPRGVDENGVAHVVMRHEDDCPAVSAAVYRAAGS